MIINRGELEVPNPLEDDSELDAVADKKRRHPGLLAPLGTGQRVVPAPGVRRKPAPKPRPEESTKVMTELKKVLGFTKKKTLASLMLTQADIDASERLLLALNTEQLKKLVATQQSFYTPIGIYLATYAKKLLVDLKEGKTEGVDKLRARQYKAMNASVEHTGIPGAGEAQSLKIEIVGAEGVAEELAKLMGGNLVSDQDSEQVIDTEATEL